MTQTNEQLCKIFIGGLAREADEQSLRKSFAAYGNILDVSVMRDQLQKSRGFGFVVFDDPACVDDIMKAKKDGHSMMVDGGHVEVKRALPRVEKGDLRDRASSRNAGIKRTFIGGLSSVTKEEDLVNYFSRFGKVIEANVMMDKLTNKSRGFGFVTFDDEDVADKVCALRDHEINSKLCEVRKAESRQKINHRREREYFQQPGRYQPEYNPQGLLPNVGVDASSLNSAVQLLSSLQALLNTTQLQQNLSHGNRLPNLSHGLAGAVPAQPVQPPVAQNTNQNNVLQLLQTALSSQNTQATTPVQQAIQPPAAAQPNNQLNMLLSALQANNSNQSTATSGISQAGLSGILGSLSGQSSAAANKDSLASNVTYPLQGATSTSATESSNIAAANQSMSYYDEAYGNQSQHSSSYGPVRYPQSRSDSKSSSYRPY